MRILLKMIFVLIGLGLMPLGGWLIAVGYADSTRVSGSQSARYSVQGDTQALRYLRPKIQKQLPKDYKELLKLKEHGLLYPLGFGGGLIALMGLIFFSNGLFRFKAPNRNLQIYDTVGKIKTATAESSTVGKPSISIDETKFSENNGQQAAAPAEAAETAAAEYDDNDDIQDIKYLVSLLQSTLNSDEVKKIVTFYRRDILEFLPLFSEDGGNQLGHQIIQATILRHQRQRKDTTPDQFQIQDTRINQCESKSFARRYMPKTAPNTEHSTQAIGKVFDFHEQAQLQQKLGGESSDWMDVSLRNAHDVLTARPPTETVA